MEQHPARRSHEVVVVSAHRRVGSGLRALLEAAGVCPVLDARPDAADAVQGARVAVLDLTGDVAMPPALMSCGAPPVVGICRGRIPPGIAERLAAAVQVDDGVDAIVSAVRRAAR